MSTKHLSMCLFTVLCFIEISSKFIREKNNDFSVRNRTGHWLLSGRKLVLSASSQYNTGHHDRQS